MTATATPPRVTPPAPPRSAVARGPLGPASGLLEAATVALTLAAAVDVARLFHSMGGFLGPVVLVALAVHGACWAARRRDLGLGAAALGATVAAGLVVTWTLFPHHTFLGLPTRATFEAGRAALSDAATRFRSTSVPATLAPGFTLAGAIGCALAAFLADWAAFRMRATVEAALPSLSLLVFSAALAQGHRSTLAVGVWLAAALGFLVVRESGVQRPGPAWFASRSGRGPAAVLRTGALLGAVVVLGLALVGTHLPGATGIPLVPWRHTGGPSSGRITESPLVDIRARLQQEPGAEVFTVRTATPAYWRITALDTFDGNGWSLDNTYRHTGSALATPTTAGVAVSSRFTISALSSIWLPAAFKPVTYHGPGHVSYSADADSLVIDKGTTDGMTYAVASSVPTPSVETLRSSPSAVDDPTVAHYLELPGLPRSVQRLVVTDLRTATAGALTPYDKARDLQDWFRQNFTYDLNVPPDDGTNAIIDFLTVRRGFCQQFAGTYAVMARLLGLPTRVAVGFTPGVVGSDGLLHVRDQQAHAWPEVWFEGVGWVPFEPTPGRGAPQAQGYTGVPPQQDTGGPSPSVIPPAVVTPTTVVGGATPTTTPPPPKLGVNPASQEAKRHHHRSFWSWVGVVLAWCSPLLLLAVAPLLRRIRRQRRRRAADTPGARVLLAWDEAAEDLSLLGAPRRRSDTPSEYAARASVAAALPSDGAGALAGLAEHVVTTSYAGEAVGEDAARQAEAQREVIAEIAAASRSRWQRIVSEVDPRGLVGSMRSGG